MRTIRASLIVRISPARVVLCHIRWPTASIFGPTPAHLAHTSCRLLHSLGQSAWILIGGKNHLVSAIFSQNDHGRKRSILWKHFVVRDGILDGLAKVFVQLVSALL